MYSPLGRPQLMLCRVVQSFGINMSLSKRKVILRINFYFNIQRTAESEKKDKDIVEYSCGKKRIGRETI